MVKIKNELAFARLDLERALKSDEKVCMYNIS